MGFAQETLALIDAVRRQPRRARPQQHAPLVKAVAKLAIETGGAHGLVVIGGIIELPHVAGLPGGEPRRYLRRRPFADFVERRNDPAPVLQDQGQLRPEHMAWRHELQPDPDVAVRSGRPRQPRAPRVRASGPRRVESSRSTAASGWAPTPPSLVRAARRSARRAAGACAAYRRVFRTRSSGSIRAGRSDTRCRRDPHAPRTSRPATTADRSP